MPSPLPLHTPDDCHVPAEILIKIFTWLVCLYPDFREWYVIRGVCHGWREAAHQIPAVYSLEYLSRPNLLVILGNFPDVRCGIEFTAEKAGRTPEREEEIVEWCAPGYLTAIAEVCTRLTSVDFSYCCDALTNAAVVALAAGCPGLTQVNFKFCHLLTAASVVALARGSPGLTSVNFGGCHLLTDEAVAALAPGCPGLTSVNFEVCGQLTDAAVAALAAGCPGLTKVHLLGCLQLTDAAVVALVEGCPGLTKVNFRGCELLTAASVVTLAEVCPGLTSDAFWCFYGCLVDW